MRYKRKKDNDMSPLVKETISDLQSKLNLITLKAPLLKTNRDSIELDINNPKHKEWYEVDKYKGQ